MENAGYNQVAEINNIIVVYPQTRRSWPNPKNALSCYDMYELVTGIRLCIIPLFAHAVFSDCCRWGYTTQDYGELRMLSSSIAFHYFVVCMLHLSIYLATNKGPQMMSIKAMLDRAAGLASTLFS